MSQGPYDLRHRHGSQIGINNPDIPQNDLESEASLSPIKEKSSGEPESKDQEEIPVISMRDFQQVDMNEKLDLLMSAINKINMNFHHKFEDLSGKLKNIKEDLTPRISSLESKVVSMQVRMDHLEENNTALKDELAVIKGLLQVNDNNVSSLSKKVIDLTARSMANNIIITGIMGDSEQEQDCKAKVLDFMRTHLKIEDLQDHEVEVAHRSKGKIGPKPRVMIVRCQHSLRDRIFNFTKNLKSATNSQGDPYFVSKQLLEPLLTEKREHDQRIKEVHRSNSQLPEDQKHKKIDIQVSNNVLYLNKIPQKKHISPQQLKAYLIWTQETETNWTICK